MFGFSAQREAIRTNLAEIILIALVQVSVVPILGHVDFAVEVRVVGHIGVFDSSVKLNGSAVLVVERFPDSLIQPFLNLCLAQSRRVHCGRRFRVSGNSGRFRCCRLGLARNSGADDILNAAECLLNCRGKAERLTGVVVKINYL